LCCSRSGVKAHVKVKVKWYRYIPGVDQRVGRGIALLFHDDSIRRGWVVSNTPRPHFTPGKDPVPILQEAGWAPGPLWTGGKSRPHRDSIPDRPARSQSLYWLSYSAHIKAHVSVLFSDTISYNCASACFGFLLSARTGLLLVCGSQINQCFSSRAYYFALYMEAVCLYELLVNYYQTTRRHIPDDSNLHIFVLNKANMEKITITE